jgi:iron complex transport system substrate-binding protein
VGDLNLNFEKIVSLKPDLVVGIRSMQEDALLRLQKLGLKVLALEPQGIDGTLEAIETLGLVTGKKAEADQLKAKIQGQLAGVKQLKPKPKVLLVLDLDPLYTVGPGSLQHELLERAGGENIAEDADNPWPQLDEEVVIAKDPDLILVTADQKARILAKPAWRHIAAVKEKRIYAVDPDLISRPGPRLGIAVRELARVMSK